MTPHVEQGDPDGVPVILLHGLSDSHRSYEPLLEHLPHEIRAFALTARGHGDAERPADGYDPSTLAADVAAFMDARGLDEAVIVGHSAGTYTAQQLAVEHPGRVAGLVLIGAVRSGPEHAALLEMSGFEYGDPIDPAFVREFQESTLALPVPPEYLEMVIDESLKLPAHVWRAAVRGLVDHVAPTALGQIRAPTLLLWGELDEICPRDDQERLAATIPADLIAYPGSGHAPHWERPQRVAADLAAFSLRAPLRPRSAVAR